MHKLFVVCDAWFAWFPQVKAIASAGAFGWEMNDETTRASDRWIQRSHIPYAFRVIILTCWVASKGKRRTSFLLIEYWLVVHFFPVCFSWICNTSQAGKPARGRPEKIRVQKKMVWPGAESQALCWNGKLNRRFWPIYIVNESEFLLLSTLCVYD